LIGCDLIINITDSDDVRLEPYRHVRERDLLGRDGMFIAEGKIVLSILIARADYALDSVLLLENRVQSNKSLLEKIPDNIPVYVVPQHVIDTVAGYNVHRGILAIGRRTEVPRLPELLDRCGHDCLLVILSDISNHDNVGSIFRNAAAFSADAVIMDSLCCDPLYRKSLRVSVGAVLTVPWVKGPAIPEIATILSENGFSIAALSPSGTRSIKDLPTKGKRAILLGSEGHGLPKHLLESLGSCKIPMSPDFDSLNVATASGIALFAASRYAQ
jgi:tRNA G18 (ribose-2'-O)-methylase SpoU